MINEETHFGFQLYEYYSIHARTFLRDKYFLLLFISCEKQYTD